MKIYEIHNRAEPINTFVYVPHYNDGRYLGSLDFTDFNISMVSRDDTNSNYNDVYSYMAYAECVNHYTPGTLYIDDQQSDLPYEFW